MAPKTRVDKVAVTCIAGNSGTDLGKETSVNEQRQKQLHRAEQENICTWVRTAWARARRVHPASKRVRRLLGILPGALKATLQRWALERSPRLYSLLIETCSMCNRRCHFCPVAYYPRPKKLMRWHLYAKIISELKEIGFAGKIGLHSYNEPLLDKRLPRLIRYARNNLPSATIMFSTNGDLMTLELWLKLREAGLDYAWIKQYDGHINPNVRHVMEHLSGQERKRFQVSVFSAYTDTRGGLLKHMGQLEAPLKAGCLRPRFQMVIAFDGKVPICCQDYLARHVMGDVNRESLMDIWNNRKFQHARAHLRLKDRSFSIVCSNCNASHMYPR